MFRSIGKIFKHSFYLGIKDLTVFARDRMMLATFIVMPIFMMIMMGYVFPSENVIRDAPLGIVNLDDGETSNKIVEILRDISEQNGLFRLVDISQESEAVEEIKSQTINGAFIIPADFSEKILSGEQGKITIISDQSNPQLSIMLTSALDKIMTELSTALAIEGLTELLPGVSNPEAVVKPFVVENVGVIHGEPNYFQFMAPGIMAMVIMTAAMTGVAGSISREREMGTLDGILAAPISRLSIVLGKSFAQSVRGIVQALLTLVLAITLFGVTVQGSMPLLVLLLLLTVFSFIGIGIMVSALSSEQETAMTIMAMLTFPMIFLSGAFFPIQQMPQAMQIISKFIPLSYAVEALRKCIILGTGPSGMMTEIWVLVGFGVVFTAIAIPIFNRVITR